ncbi:Hint domain-containing protein [Amycolatopsis sp. CA-161197]|uniref:Hint domain-containing protein n=1 Tax=Amycolatopsis sp. CA-161197 TaxID=3239922 RepID=UPI003D91FA2F
MADGSRRSIESTKLGEWVEAADPVTGRSVARQVVGTVTGEGWKTLIQIRMTGSSETIAATGSHPFWLPTRQACVPASELRTGDMVRGIDRQVRIASTVKVMRPLRVYNITVDVDHVYRVMSGDQAILVHNGRPPRQAPDPAAEGPHTTFRYAGDTDEIKMYAEWAPPSDPRDPKPLVLQKRFDRYGPAHVNRDGSIISTPHINLPDGSARTLEQWELPGGC